ncbi:uncharacterized protein LOC131625170 [Vicia villosa]|uniref:uncharacterized protein LOC131625170 n=1 Tax=Vicia villosa TaxID=3911 RepID=UPI00273BFD21|nr:uncharacterized protein LOC131625170 [Vicia villosa]
MANKGTSSLAVSIHKIQQYLDCRYVSSSEACWRIFSLKIHTRKPIVEHMFFHLIGEKVVSFTGFERVENVLDNTSATKFMFAAWFIVNEKYEEARTPSYDQFVTKFGYEKRSRSWKPRKKGFSIGWLVWFPPTTGELFYLRMMFTVVKDTTYYEDIRKVGET